MIEEKLNAELLESKERELLGYLREAGFNEETSEPEIVRDKLVITIASRFDVDTFASRRARLDENKVQVWDCLRKSVGVTDDDTKAIKMGEDVNPAFGIRL